VVADATDSPELECSACRGTGKVISALGGEPRPVTCPWCEGSGRFLPDHDAQSARREAAAGGADDEDADGGDAVA
jgi:DnaJ-class molecular chaperone